MKIRYVIWDFSTQINMAELSQVLQEVFNGKTLPCISEVDTHSGDCGILITSENVNQEQAQGIFDKYDNWPTKKNRGVINPSEQMIDIEWP